MPNAKRPAGPTKPMHLEREKAIEREQMDEALGLGAAAADAANDDDMATGEARDAGTAGAGAGGSARASTGTPARPSERAGAAEPRAKRAGPAKPAAPSSRPR